MELFRTNNHDSVLINKPYLKKALGYYAVARIRLVDYWCISGVALVCQQLCVGSL